MLDRWVHRPAWLFFAALLAAAPGIAAEDDAVRIRCDALTPEDAAQIEARTRATLLTIPAASLSVRVECDATTGNVFVAGGAHAQSITLSLSGGPAREALLAAIERALAALQQRAESPPADPSLEPMPAPADTTEAPRAERLEPTPPPPPVTPAPVTPALMKPPTESPVPPPPRPARPGWLVAAGVLGESWSGTLGLGARVAFERRLPPWSIGATFGWLTSSEGDSFRANELQAALFAALEDRATTGLRGSVGGGLSVLVVAPGPDIVVRSDTTLSLVFLDLGVSRPVRFGQASLLPALGLRLFPGRRQVLVDDDRRLVLPPLCPSFFLGFGYEI